MSINYENKSISIQMARRNRLACGAHLHKEIEIVYMLSGRSHAYLDSVEYELNAGDLFFSFPNKVHYYRTDEKEDYIILIASCESFPDFSSVLLKSFPVRPVIRREKMPREVSGLLNGALEALYSEQPYHEAVCKGYLSAFMGSILPCFSYESVSTSNTDMLSAVLSYCLMNYTENVSLDSMAEALHASKYYISRLFSEKIRICFNGYINMLRINEARERLLKTDASITQIGIDVGYNTIRSFNRAFLQQTGMQPRQYRNLYRGE